MNSASNSVRIWFCGDDPEDRHFADRIVRSARAYTEAFLMDVDELERADERGVPREEGYRGTPVYIISRTMVSRDYHRRKLIHATALRGAPGYMAFYICRGTTFADLKEDYPDLGELLDRVMVGEEADLGELLHELQEYTFQKPSLIQPVRLLLPQWLASVVGVVLGTVLYPLYYVGFIAAVILGYFLLLSPPKNFTWAAVMAALAAYSAGFNLNRLTALDFWPWLGSRWRLPQTEVPLRKAYAAPANVHESFLWLTDQCLGSSILEEGQSDCSETELHSALRAWFGTLLRARNLHVFQLLLLLIPVAALLIDQPLGLATGVAAALAVGLTFPVFYCWATDFTRWWAFGDIGLGDCELQRTDDVFAPSGQLLGGIVQVEGSSRPEVRRRLQAEAWALNHSIGSSGVRRLWFPRRDHVFISYAWADEVEINVATRLKEVFDALDTPCFLDRRDVRSKFSAWRSQVSRGLLESTHVFVVVGPRVLQGSVIRRELKLTLQRWNSELLPAVICVADPAVTMELLTRADLPAELRFILAWCPQLSLQEAQNPEIVRGLVWQRRRQGLLKDWLTLLTPVSTIRRLLASERL